MPKTYRYKVTANAKAELQFSADDYAEQSAKKAKEIALADFNKKSITSGEIANLVKIKRFEISDMKVEKLGPCRKSFYETREC